MISLATPYDKYIDRPNLTGQTKNSFEHIVPSPLKCVGAKIVCSIVLILKTILKIEFNN